MRDGDIRTDTLAALGVPDPPALAPAVWQRAAAALAGQAGDGPWHGGWRLNEPPSVRLRTGDEERGVALKPSADAEEPAAVVDGDAAHVDVEGRSVAFRLAPPPTVEEAVRHATAERRRPRHADRTDARPRHRRAGTGRRGGRERRARWW